MPGPSAMVQSMQIGGMLGFGSPQAQLTLLRDGIVAGWGQVGLRTVRGVVGALRGVAGSCVQPDDGLTWAG